MNTVKVSLSTDYTSIPAHCKIFCCKKLIFDDIVKKSITLNHNFESVKNFEINIVKDGRTLNIAKKHKQIVYIKNINLNGIDLKINEFGIFNIKNNFFTSDQMLQTTQLTFNGEWNLKLVDTYNIPGHLTKSGLKKSKLFSNCNIACFGASNTFRITDKENFQTGLWPDYLRQKTNLKINNYADVGSSIPEITAMVKKYTQKFFKPIVILFLPHTFRFQIKKNSQWTNSFDFNLLEKNVVLQGEAHYIAVLSNKLKKFFNELSKKNSIFFCSDNESEYNLFKKTQLRKYLITPPKFSKYQKDKNGHWEEKFHKDFANRIIKQIDIL